MKVTLINNSCSRISRLYAKFELDLPGNSEREADVPDVHVENLKRYLEAHHPAVIFRPVVGEPVTAVAPVSVAATTTDASIIDINVDDQDPADSGITIEQYIRNAGLLADTADEIKETPEALAVPADPAAATAPEAAKAKKAANLIPAKKGKPAKTPGGSK